MHRRTGNLTVTCCGSPRAVDVKVTAGTEGCGIEVVVTLGRRKGDKLAAL